jgi:transcriptional regulator with GAF, ATPase, and Fis domain
MRVVTEAEIRRMERENIVRALKISNGRIYGAGGAAELLGVKPSTLSTRIQKLGLK